MRRYDKITPASTRDLLFGECESLRRVQDTLCGLYEKRGFREVMTPSLEFYDVFEHSFGRVGPQQMIKLTDAQNRLICLRPDCTVPIARMVCTKLRCAPLPIRLYYNQTVYTAPREHSGKAAELPQVGAELIGGAGEDSDLEILSLAAESLRALDAHGGRTRLEICHIGFYKALIKALGAPEEVNAQVRGLIERKNCATLGDLLRPYAGRPGARALAALPRLFGGREVLGHARALTEDPGALEALASIEALYARLEQAGLGADVIIDLGLINEADYYTGVIFRGFLEGTGEPVLSGGRYDRLLEAFGWDLPATGFGVSAAAVASRRHAPKADAECVTIALTKGRLERRAARMLEEIGYDCSALRDKGRRLVLPLGDSGVRVVLAKAADVLTYVENGAADIGIVGKDTIMENGGSFYEVLDLGFGRCRFALACREGDDVFTGYSAKVIASKYPRVALNYFEEKGLDVDVVKIEGSVELAPMVGLADAIVDIVETGGTLRENGLTVVEDIAPVSARMIVNTASMKLKQRRIGEILDKVEEYLCRK